jgi:hypothetical protein
MGWQIQRLEAGRSSGVALSLVPLVAGQLSLLPRLRVRAPS